MYKKTEKKSEEIIRLYKEGKMLTEICKLTSSSQPSVKKVLSNVGIDYNLEQEEKRRECFEKVLSLYQEGKSQIFIEKELNLTRKTIREFLKSKDVEYRNLSNQAHIRYETEIDHNVFDELTCEALYWIGMLYTDGHIEQNKEASIELTLHNNDINHLEKFKAFLKSNRDVKKGKGDCSRMRVNSKKIRDRLVDLGFTHNKSVSIIPHNLLKQSKDFWRGCIDGDGGIYWRKDNTGHLTLCGTLETIFEFIFFCSEIIQTDKKYPTQSNGKNLYQVSYYGEDAKKIANYLYKDSCISLDRKYQIYKTYFTNNLKL
jgi:hypothetical protein